jgi:uncharacterized protein YjiS (DUF1127 family)
MRRIVRRALRPRKRRRYGRERSVFSPRPARRVRKHAPSRQTETRFAMFIARPFDISAALFACAETVCKALGRAQRWCSDCQARAEQRRALAELDERMLKDVGIAPSTAAREIAKPFWRA